MQAIRRLERDSTPILGTFTLEEKTMRKLLTLLIALAAIIFAVYSPASAQMTLTGAGSSKLPAAIGGGGYTGPGDINGPAIFWGGLRAFSAAYAASLGPAVDIVDTSNANPATINVTAAGDLDITTLNAWIALHGTAVVAKLYDQSGNGNHFTNTSGASTKPKLFPGSVTGLNSSRPALNFKGSTGTGSTFLQNAGFAVSQTFSYSWVGERNGYGGAAGPVITEGTTGNFFGWDNSSGRVGMSFGAGVAALATESAWHSVQGLVNAGSSDFYMDGTLSSVNPGTGGFAGTNSLTMGQLFGISPNFIQEIGIWSGDKSANNAAMYNGAKGQKTYWGF